MALSLFFFNILNVTLVAIEWTKSTDQKTEDIHVSIVKAE